MSEQTEPVKEEADAQMELTNLYREEIYTDRKIGVIRCLVPVLADGNKDESRPVIYTGEAQIMTQMGAFRFPLISKPTAWKPRSRAIVKQRRPVWNAR